MESGLSVTGWRIGFIDMIWSLPWFWFVYLFLVTGVDVNSVSDDCVLNSLVVTGISVVFYKDFVSSKGELFIEIVLSQFSFDSITETSISCIVSFQIIL